MAPREDSIVLKQITISNYSLNLHLLSTFYMSTLTQAQPTPNDIGTKDVRVKGIKTKQVKVLSSLGPHGPIEDRALLTTDPSNTNLPYSLYSLT